MIGMSFITILLRNDIGQQTDLLKCRSTQYNDRTITINIYREPDRALYNFGGWLNCHVVLSIDIRSIVG